MSKESEKFLMKMQELFLSTVDEYTQCVEKNGEVLETVIIEDIFMPLILELINENRNLVLLDKTFKYFEEVVKCNDSHLINIFSITVLEMLGNDKTILRKAQKYMGPQTIQLQMKVDRELGR